MRTLAVAVLAVILPGVYAEEELPGIYGVYNEASLGGAVTVARGSNILIFSGTLAVGPAAMRTSTGYPLVTNLDGTSVRVTVGGNAVDAYVLGAETLFVRALLPSTTPLGNGTLVVTYNGRSTVPYRISVVERQFAIYDGSWCGPSSLPKQPGFCVPRDTSGNSLLEPARPGQLATLRGTGLGAAPGDEAAAPIPGDLGIPGLQVMVGNQAAKIVYAGRAGCCAGMDEIVFEVPPGIEGCGVPVWVRFGDDGSATGDILLAIASGTGACTDPQGLSEAEVRRLAAGTLSAAQISIAQNSWSAAFGRAAADTVTPAGTCRQYSWGGSFTVEVAPESLEDAGRALTLQTPHRSFPAARTETGFYGGLFEGDPEPGHYTVDNSGGSAVISPFRTQFTFPARKLTWTNQDDFPTTVTWDGAEAGDGYDIVIVGTLGTDGEVSGGFICHERAAKGSFTIPAAILERAGINRPEMHELNVSVISRFSERVAIPGIDVGEFAFFSPLGTKTAPLH